MNATTTPKPVLMAQQAYSFEFQNNNGKSQEIDDHLVNGYSVLYNKGEEQYYVSLEDKMDDRLNIYPSCNAVGSSEYIFYQGSLVECWSLDQYCLATSSKCQCIHDGHD